MSDKRGFVEVLSGVGALGISYHSCPYWGRRDGRPSLHLSLWWVKIITHLPFKHVTPRGHGAATSEYGFFWWPSLNKKPRFFWKTLKAPKHQHRRFK